MTITDQIRNALDGLSAIEQHFIPCINHHSCKGMAKLEAKKRNIKITVVDAKGGIIIKRAE